MTCSDCVYNSIIRQAIYMFLAKTSCFIFVIIPLTNQIVDQFRLVKPIDRSIPAKFPSVHPNE
jgi:hypothetical protein